MYNKTWFFILNEIMIQLLNRVIQFQFQWISKIRNNIKVVMELTSSTKLNQKQHNYINNYIYNLYISQNDYKIVRLMVRIQVENLAFWLIWTLGSSLFKLLCCIFVFFKACLNKKPGPPWCTPHFSLQKKKPFK